MRQVTPWLAVALPLALSGAWTRPQAPHIQWRPNPPRQGSLILLVSATPVQGTLAGEPLHFEAAADGRFAALAGIPIDAPDTVPLLVTIDSVEDTLPVPVAKRRTAREELRTAPQFTRPPDSALAARLERERDLVRATFQGSHARPRLWSAPFRRPRTSRVRSSFGLAREFNDVVESRHLGVDFAGTRGAPVRAANRGVVAFVEELFYAGRTVYVDHGAGLLTAYMHLDRALVAAGDTVERGQLIGRVGSSGRVTGPHLHWLARYGAVLVDPLALVTLDLTPLVSPP
ncbi:MAG TPA: M23 family metallopeptidase [Gemmatimonadales bacterium]|jgi:murein DD-endopeptidase MepM/ murein hydrolase activator NlpD